MLFFKEISLMMFHPINQMDAGLFRKMEVACSIIRNHLWKGYTSYHAVGTQYHGGIYVGDGLKNLNICFMM